MHLALDSSDKSHDPEYEDSDTEKSAEDPADDRDDADDAYNYTADGKKDTVVNVILNECVILLGCDKKTEKPKDSDVAKDSEHLVVANGCCGIATIDDRFIIIFHYKNPPFFIEIIYNST